MQIQTKEEKIKTLRNLIKSLISEEWAEDFDELMLDLQVAQSTLDVIKKRVQKDEQSKG